MMAQPDIEKTKLLLDRGAQVNGRSKSKYSPLMLASFSGNADLIGPLMHAGARLDEKMLVLGMFPNSATANAIAFGDLATTRALLDAGADPNEADDAGFTLPYDAVIGNHTEVARLPIERGADVNAVDACGMTPLLYARTKEGLTAQDLARKYGHTYLAASFVSSSLR